MARVKFVPAALISHQQAMSFSDVFKWFGRRSLELSNYHPFAVRALNQSPYDITLRKHPDAVIGGGFRPQGDIRLDSGVSIGRNCAFYGDIHIGRGTTLTRDIDIIGDVEIKRYTTVARDSTFQANNHSISAPSVQNRLHTELLGNDNPRIESDIVVGNDVWIGTKAVVLPGVEIGDGAVIGAGSIVSDDIEPYAVQAGVPAKRIKWRFDAEIRKLLQEIKWWNWSEKEIRTNREFFETDLTTIANPESFLKEYIHPEQHK
jgi:virginiamycin A acetyltransferase